MSAGRVVSTLISCAAVCGVAVVVIGMAQADTAPRASGDRGSTTTATGERPGYVPRVTAQPTLAVAATSPDAASSVAAATTRPAGTASALPRATTAVIAPRTTTAAPTMPPPVRTTASVAITRSAAPRPVTTTTSAAAAKAPAKPAGNVLPLRYTTGSATRVVTVTAASSRSTRATLQAWTKLSNGRWAKYGSAVRAYVGADGVGKASETRSTTPAGSFTLTQAFGSYRNPGTSLPYLATTPSDYWISSPGAKYNTHQRCGSCGYNNGVNERLYYVNPEYRYAAVIDYNTPNAPGGVKQGAGSAFFLHVANGAPTAGCVAIPQSKLVTILRWLTPKAHPRILIGVT